MDMRKRNEVVITGYSPDPIGRVHELVLEGRSIWTSCGGPALPEHHVESLPEAAELR